MTSDSKTADGAVASQRVKRHIILYICTLVDHMTFLPGFQISLAHSDMWLLITIRLPTVAIVFLFIATFPSMVWREPNWADTLKALRIETHIAIWL